MTPCTAAAVQYGAKCVPTGGGSLPMTGLDLFALVFVAVMLIIVGITLLPRFRSVR